MKSRCFLAVVAATALFAPGLSSAQPRPAFKLTLDYDGVLLVKVLDIRVEQTASRDAFVSTASMKSYGVLSLFKRLDVKARSVGHLRGAGPSPARFQHSNEDGVVNRSVEVLWRADDVATRATPGYLTLGDPAPTAAQKLGAADPLTALMRIAMPAPGAGPCSREARLFDGRQLYALRFSPATARALGARERALGLDEAVRCKLTFSEVAGFDAKPEGRRNQGLKGPLTVDFARAGSGGPWILTAARGRTPLGDARVDIRGVRMDRSETSQALALN